MTTDVTASALNDDFTSAIHNKTEEARAFLSLSGNETPPAVVGKIRDAVDRLLSENHASEALREYAIQLGCLWGTMVEHHYQWQWQYLDFGEEVQGIYLVSPQALYCCPPLYFLDRILSGANTGLDGNNDNTVMLLFNMLDGIENQVPPQKYQVVA